MRKISVNIKTFVLVILITSVFKIFSYWSFKTFKKRNSLKRKELQNQFSLICFHNIAFNIIENKIKLNCFKHFFWGQEFPYIVLNDDACF